MVKHSESGPITSSSNWGWTQEHARNTPAPTAKNLGVRKQIFYDVNVFEIVKYMFSKILAYTNNNFNQH